MEQKPSILRQPTAVWAIAFACAVSFMGIGLVDPILPAISHDLDASPSQTMLLFTSYLLITAVAMFFSGFISSRLGVKRTLLAGLTLIVVFAALAGASQTVDQIIGFRAGWGLGNALFISTALAAIVGAASGGSRQAVILYEAALGIGMAVGPLLGGALGEVAWQGPFFGTAALMAVALIAIVVLLRGPAAAPAPVSITAGFTALRNPALLTLAVTALFYNYGFFTLLAYSPYPIEAAAADAGMHFGAHELGLVFFGWGTALAITSVFAAPLLTRRFGLLPVLYSMFALLAASLATMAAGVGSAPVLITVVIVAGLFLGVLNTALTETVMEATDLPRNVASSTYSGVRFLGGAIAPAVSGGIAEAMGEGAPYWFGFAALLVSILVLAVGKGTLAHLGRPHGTAQEEAQLITAGDEV
ncbi:MFS transporter [Glycomyces sp. A-F 0318]|uniref:MFS transporter n=1 Tax=Glycomyces amatae TaxID=2881355 RepID=UPI001E6028AE|nr:MFS transporter [Glycomyces amatae]MCD0442587.1 MFS transporter [Glycomyces amatae]